MLVTNISITFAVLKHDEDYSCRHEYAIYFLLGELPRFELPEGLRPAGTPYFLSVSHLSYIHGRVRPVLTSQLALSPFLHSRRHHRKLRTSFPRGGCPIEKFNQLDRRKTFLPLDLTGEQAASSGFAPLSATRRTVRACLRIGGATRTAKVEARHLTHGHVCSTPTRTSAEY